jgi:hypothetical protein
MSRAILDRQGQATYRGPAFAVTMRPGQGSGRDSDIVSAGHFLALSPRTR